MWSRTGPIEDAVETFGWRRTSPRVCSASWLGPSPALGGCVCGGGLASERVSKQTRRETQKSVAVPGELRSLSATDASAVSTSAQHVRAGVDAQPDIPNP